jgi:hypothetical protein
MPSASSTAAAPAQAARHQGGAIVKASASGAESVRRLSSSTRSSKR